ncbi:MAG: hypothetical protein IPK52_16585 [Chloroflexi bacterium]|nr:hypothetical protein [Chloroflexota bacterium]
MRSVECCDCFIQSVSPSIYERNKRIWQRFEEGEGLSDIARDYDISPQCISQVLRHRCRTEGCARSSRLMTADVSAACRE